MKEPTSPELPADPEQAGRSATDEPAVLQEVAGSHQPARQLPELKPLPRLPQRPRRPQMPLPKPLKGGLKERRAQRQRMVAQAIVDHPIRSQTELQALLDMRGVLTTQSSISRDLRDLGVQRVKGVYVIKPSREEGWSFDDVIELVEMVTRSGTNLTVIQTVPDAARFVARALEETGWDEVVGTVAGDDTIFVATRTQEDQDRLFQRFKQYMKV